MKKIMKRVVALAAVATMTITAFVGCASSSVDNSAVVATVGEQKITAGLLNFYLRYQQTSLESYYGSYYGDAFWSLEMDGGQNYEEYLKEATLDTLYEYYLLDMHTEEYEVALSEDELAAIDEAAAAFVEANTEEAIEKISGQKENAAELLRLMAISQKMYDAIIADVDTEVADEEAAQKRLAYVSFAKTTTDEDYNTVELSEEEVAALQTEAQNLLAAAKENGSLSAYAEETEAYTASTATFDSESTSPAAEVVEAADALAEGEFADVIETDDTIYVVQLESLFDEEATETEKESIISERESELYTEVVDGWKEETELTTDKSVLKKIDVYRLKVTQIEEEEETTEETTEDTTEDETEETTEDTAEETTEDTTEEPAEETVETEE